MSQESEKLKPDHTFYVSSFYWYIGMGLVLATPFLLLAILTPFAWEKFQADPITGTIFFVIIWISAAIFGGYFLIVFRDSRLDVFETEISEKRPFGTTSIILSDIESIEWNPEDTGGSCQLSGKNRKLHISLKEFGEVDRDKLIRILRNIGDDAIHEQWDEFTKEYPLIEHTDGKPIFRFYSQYTRNCSSMTSAITLVVH